jgi:hypothetical protein
LQWWDIGYLILENASYSETIIHERTANDVANIKTYPLSFFFFFLSSRISCFRLCTETNPFVLRYSLILLPSTTPTTQFQSSLLTQISFKIEIKSILDNEPLEQSTHGLKI